MKKNYLQLLGFVVLCLSVGWLGSAVTASSRVSWYAGLQKPPLNPPDWIFAPVWTVLYILMAIAGWRLWHLPEGGKLRVLFVIQLIFNVAWSFFFFGLRNPLAGLTDIVFLWVSLALLLAFSFRRDRTAGWLLAPYFLWVSFAAYLNAAIGWLNRG